MSCVFDTGGMIMKKFDLSGVILSAAAASLMMTSITGCDDNGRIGEESQLHTSLPEKQNVENYSTKSLGMPQDINYAQSIHYSNGNIYVSGYRTSLEISEYSKMLNIKTFESEEFTFDFPINYINKVLMDKENIYVSYTDEDYNTIFSSVDRKTGKELIRNKIDDFCNIKDIFSDNQGNICTLNINQDSVFNDPSSESILSIYNKDLTLKETVNLNQKLGLQENEQITRIIPDGRKSYYAVSCCNAQPFTSSTMTEIKTKLYKFSDDYKIQFETENFGEDDTGSGISDCFMTSDGNLYAAFFTNNLSRKILHIDELDGNVIDSYEIPDAAVFFGSTDEYDVIYQTFNNEGLYGYNFQTGESSMLFTYDEELGAEFSNITSYSICGDNMLVNTENSDDNSISIFVMDETGKVNNEIRLTSQNKDGYIENIHVSGTDQIYCFESAEIRSDDNDLSYIKSYTVDKFDSSGKLLDRMDLSDELGNENQIFVEDIITDNDDDIFILYQRETEEDSRTLLTVIDKNGNIKNTSPLSESLENIKMASLTDGTVCVVGVKDKKIFISKIDENNGMVIEEEIQAQTEAISTENCVIYQGDEKYNFYYKTDNILYGYSLKSDESTEVFDIEKINWDIDVQTLYPINESRIICMGFSNDACDTEQIYIVDKIK